MKSLTRQQPLIVFVVLLIVTALACSMPGLGNPAPSAEPQASEPSANAPTQSSIPTGQANALPTFAPPTPTPSIAHALIPATNIIGGKSTFDVVSVDTAAENRAPYGDSYKINRFERPFTQNDMVYVPDVDIASYSISKDEKFFYVSIELVGTNPNNDLGINYTVEIDTDADGFGDYAITAQPPYNIEWTTDNVKVLQDKDHDTGGLSPEKSDAPLPGNGYEKLIFNGGRGEGDDPDLAWVRVNAGRVATVQFAFKIWLAENRFMYGVYADAGIKDIGKLDYVDRFTETEAGSPEKSEKDYPVKAVYLVDNVCRDVFGFTGNGEEPQRCPADIKPEGKPRTCEQPSYCYVWDSTNCVCLQQGVPCLSQGTTIDTPNGPVNVENLRVGDAVWTMDQNGNKIIGHILQTSNPRVQPNHQMAIITLSDGRELKATPGHPTADGRTLADLKVGDVFDGATVVGYETITYGGERTYDILPDGGTGYYWANGVLIGSTLAEK